jgi:hypothetical protein
MGTVRQSQYAIVAQKAINADNAIKANLANTAISSSYAATASLLLGSVQSASYAATASYYGGSITSASYAATASYSKTLGASLANTDTGELKLINSANSTISSITALTASLANTSSYVTPYEGAWRSYSVSWTTDGVTQPVIGSGSITGYYKQIGKTVFVRVKLNCGSTTTFGTGSFQFSLPVTASSPDGIQFACSILDNGVHWYQGTVNGTYSGFTYKSAVIVSTSSGWANAVNANTPFTWGDTDSLQFNGSYESI